MKFITFVFLFFIIISGCSLKTRVNDNAVAGPTTLDKLSEFMLGSFDSKEQAEMDSAFYNIHLEMVRVWPERKDAIWLYVEQAASWALDKPYRQRVYRLTQLGDLKFESAVFTFEEPLRFAGAWKSKLPLGSLTVDSLQQKTGCSIYLDYRDRSFQGSTVDQYCKSELRGASYATSEVKIEEEYLTSWDRGFDSNNKQVWGAVSGPYIFKKVVRKQ